MKLQVLCEGWGQEKCSMKQQVMFLKCLVHKEYYCGCLEKIKGTAPAVNFVIELAQD